jgi:RNA recognition motif-containing protein
LQAAFETHEPVISAKIIKYLTTGRFRGFGLVEMENSSDAQNAIKAFNESELSGRNIKVNEAKECN